MPKYVIDSYAWIEYLVGTEKGEIVRKILEDPKNQIYTPTVVVAEVASITKRENRDVELVYQQIISLSKIYDFGPDFAKEVGILHAELKKKIKDFGMIDTAILLTARESEARIVTGDPYFKGFNNVIFLD